MSGSSSPAAYDLFISYARKDNTSGWVNALHQDILADHRAHSSRPLRIFFDTEAIKDLDDWRHRILGALRSSKILLVCLSPNYFSSGPCQWEFEEYIKRQIHQLIGSDSIAQIYFVTVVGSDEQRVAAEWRALLRRHNYTDVRPWFHQGPESLLLAEVRQRMAALGVSLWERLQRAQRAESAPGNLRWQNPHFLGRTKELRLLHESLGLGRIGVVTAVQGLGGMGKTELAVAYAHGFADCYPGGLWSLQAEGETELLPLIGKLAWERALGFTPTEAEKNEPALLGRGVLEHLKTRAAAVRDVDPDRGPACLILLDNVSDPALLTPAQLATVPGGSSAHWLRLIATTRLDITPQKDRLDTLAIDALDEVTALQLIEDHQRFRDAEKNIVLDPAQAVPRGVPTFASEAEKEAARQIVRALGGFTLAIEQVAIFLGIHPDVSPSHFLQQLQDKGLPLADSLVTHEEGAVAAQMLTQSKQLGLILDATLEKLSAPARTALHFAALLPPDNVPWPWLRDLTQAEHPDLQEKDALGVDPWMAVPRRLLGLRLLTPGDDVQIARMHRLVAATIKLQLADKLDASLAALHSLLRYITRGEGANWLDYYPEIDTPWLEKSVVADTILSGVFDDAGTNARMAEIAIQEYRMLPDWKDLLLLEYAVVERLKLGTRLAPECLEGFVRLAEAFWNYGLKHTSVTKHGHHTIDDVFRHLMRFIDTNPQLKKWSGYRKHMAEIETISEKAAYLTSEKWPDFFQELRHRDEQPT